MDQGRTKDEALRTKDRVMPISITLDDLRHLAPNARSSYRQAFEYGPPLLDESGISASPLRVAHFMAQVLHESTGLSVQIESLNYSPQRLPQVWPSRFKPKGPLDPALFAHNEEKLGNEVYGGRMGNDQPGDGFKYRGRGLQIVGVSLDEPADQEKLAALLARENIRWPQYFPGDGHYRTSELAQRFGVQGIPAAFLLDKQGRVVDRNVHVARLEHTMRRLLSQ